MNKKKLLAVGVISILTVLNIVFYIEGQRLQRTKLSLKEDIKDLQKSLEDKKVEYESLQGQYEDLVTKHGNCPQ